MAIVRHRLEMGPSYQDTNLIKLYEISPFGGVKNSVCPSAWSKPNDIFGVDSC